MEGRAGASLSGGRGTRDGGGKRRQGGQRSAERQGVVEGESLEDREGVGVVLEQPCMPPHHLLAHHLQQLPLPHLHTRPPLMADADAHEGRVKVGEG